MLTVDKVKRDLFKVITKLNNTEIMLNNAKLGYRNDYKIFRFLYKSDIDKFNRKIYDYKLRKKVLEILLHFPNQIVNLSYRDYLDTTKLYLILYQSECVQKFNDFEKRLNSVFNDVSNIKVHIK